MAAQLNFDERPFVPAAEVMNCTCHQFFGGTVGGLAVATFYHIVAVAVFYTFYTIARAGFNDRDMGDRGHALPDSEYAWWIGRTGIDGIREDTVPYVPAPILARLQRGHPRARSGFRNRGRSVRQRPGAAVVLPGRAREIRWN